MLVVLIKIYKWKIRKFWLILWYLRTKKVHKEKYWPSNFCTRPRWYFIEQKYKFSKKSEGVYFLSASQRGCGKTRFFDFLWFYSQVGVLKIDLMIRALKEHLFWCIKRLVEVFLSRVMNFYTYIARKTTSDIFFN